MTWLAAAKIRTFPEQVAVGFPDPKDKKGRYLIKFVGQVRDDADDQLKKLIQDPPLSRSILIPIPTYGAILNHKGGPIRAKLNMLVWRCMLQGKADRAWRAAAV